MNYLGRLILKEDNTYGLYDSKKGEFVELSKELDRLRNSVIHIVLKDKLGNKMFDAEGSMSSRRIGRGLYDIYIGEKVNGNRNEQMNKLNVGKNLTETLFENVEELVSVSIKVLTSGDDSEVAED